MSKNKTQFVILSLLRIQPAAGHEIHEFCKTRFSYFWQESYGQIYPNLKSLTEQKAIKQLPGEKKRGAMYEITPLGLKKLEAWLEESPTPRIIRDELFLKLFCGGATTLETHFSHIAEAKQDAERELKELSIAGKEIAEMEGSHPDVQFWRLILRAGVLSLQARIKWCEEVEKELGAGS